jgi:hypothetical protein
MDPDERLTEQLRGELRRLLAEMRLEPELREDLKAQLLATPASRWPRWLRTRTGTMRRGLLAGVAGVAAAGIAAAVVIPLLPPAPAGSTTRETLAVLPPGVSAGNGAALAPATCQNAAIRLTANPAQATLVQGKTALFAVQESGGDCYKLAESTSGPSAAAVSLQSGIPFATTNAGPLFEVYWTGDLSNESSRAVSPGTYKVVVSVPSSRARTTITVTVSK